jgi:purine nucleoside permease
LNSISRFLLALAGFSIASTSSAVGAPPTRPLEPRVVIVAYFEIGKDRGDKPGELQPWVEREHLDRTISVPGMFNPIYANRDGTIIAFKAGPLSINPAVNVMALGQSPQFDLRHSYWLLQGIGGATPDHGTIGSAVWTDFVVDGDAVREIDGRELPQGWNTGFYPLMANRPYPQPRLPANSEDDARSWTGPHLHASLRRDVVMLNPALARWALAVTRNIILVENKTLSDERALYAGFPEARIPARVTIGGSLSTERFWVGALMDGWANHWMSYMTDGRAVMVTTAQNDIGSLVALLSLSQAGRADADRVLLLRTTSNFDRPPPGMTLAAFLSAEQHGSYTGFDAAIEDLYRVGAPVVHSLMSHDPP